jgi:hypothetical protein
VKRGRRRRSCWGGWFRCRRSGGLSSALSKNDSASLTRKGPLSDRAYGTRGGRGIAGCGVPVGAASERDRSVRSGVDDERDAMAVHVAAERARMPDDSAAARAESVEGSKSSGRISSGCAATRAALPGLTPCP